MKARCKIIAMASTLLVFASGFLHSGRSVSAASTGQIVGTVRLDGQAPHRKPIDMSKDPSCTETGVGTRATVENVVVGSKGELANVVVYISQGLTGNEGGTRSEPVILDQKGCQYVPHVVAVDVGQHMKIMNSDKTAHNIHPEPKPGSGNNQWNKSQLAGTSPIDITWSNEEIAIPVKCNIHPWMHGYIAVVRGPVGVSNDSGAFQLDNVPPGTYTLTAWQETYGTQIRQVTVAAGKPVTADFSFKVK